MKRTRRSATCVLAIAAAGTLAACGGGGPGPVSSSFDSETAIALTGSAAPAETVADQAARSAAILARTDAIFVSTLYAELDGEGFHLASDCSGTRCTLTDPSSGTSVTVTLDDLLDVEDTADAQRAVLTRNGITLVETRGGNGGPDYRVYGAWTVHGSFSIETGAEATGEAGTLKARSSSAGGDLSGSRPSASATWRGVMVGTPARGARRDNVLQGDATLIYDLGRQTLDADFTNIADLDRNAAHTVRTVSFDSVPVAANGTYEAGGVGNYIGGGFAGPGHRETVGIFEQQGIVGAFGAKLQASN